MRDIFMSVHERVTGAVWREEEELIEKREKRSGGWMVEIEIFEILRMVWLSNNLMVFYIK